MREPMWADLEQVIWQALRRDYLLQPPLPKGTRNIECARDDVRSRIIAAAIRRYFHQSPKRLVAMLDEVFAEAGSDSSRGVPPSEGGA